MLELTSGRIWGVLIGLNLGMAALLGLPELVAVEATFDLVPTHGDVVPPFDVPPGPPAPLPPFNLPPGPPF